MKFTSLEFFIPFSTQNENRPVSPFVTLGTVATRMDTCKSAAGWTLYVYCTALYSWKRTIYSVCQFTGHIFEKSGEIRVRDSCARKRVEYRV